MRWRDIRFEKPTEADGDNSGKILQKLVSGKVTTWELLDTRACIAWMPTSDLPKPDLPGEIPAGWRAVDKAVDDRKSFSCQKYWSHERQEWVDVSLPIVWSWTDDDYYVVPIEPPKPQYRPFASAAEFMPHADRWIISDKFPETKWRPTGLSDAGVSWDSRGYGYGYLLESGAKFADDGTPFGFRID